MTLPASNYTPVGGYTPQGQQTAQGMPNAANSQAPAGSPVGSDMASFPSDQQLGDAATTANANLVPFGTTAGRQQYVTNSNLPAMQTNYDDLAKKLFDYDSGVLNPSMQGTNPGTPTDAPAFGRVEASPLGMTPESAALSSDKGLYNPNPKFAYAAQNMQAGSLVDLLNTLNKGIGDTFGQRVGTFKSDKAAAQDALDSIMKIMQQKSDVASKQAELQSNKDLEQMRLKEMRDEKALDLGYATIDPTTGQISYLDDSQRAGVNPGGSTGDAGVDSERKALQDRYNALPATSPLRSKIANSWKQAHNTPLFPGALDNNGLDQLNTSATMLRLLDNVQSELDTVSKNGTKDSLLGGLDPVGQALVQMGGPLADHLVTGPGGNLLRDLLLIQGMGDRKLMGGRLIKDLVQRFGGAFPSGNQDLATIQDRINKLRTDAVSDLKVYASSQGYTDPQQFLTDHMVDDVNLAGSKSSATTKVLNGVTYQKVSGGWQKVK